MWSSSLVHTCWGIPAVYGKSLEWDTIGEFGKYVEYRSPTFTCQLFLLRISISYTCISLANILPSKWFTLAICQCVTLQNFLAYSRSTSTVVQASTLKFAGKI